MRVFLDANVLFSASNAGSHLAKLIDLLLRTGEALTSDLGVEEARRNILLKRASWLDDFDTLTTRLVVVPSALFTLPVPLDEKDAPILCAAIQSQCEFLVTGDRRDFGHLYDQSVHGVTIISLLRLAEMLARSPGPKRRKPH
jgi:predicted nucleic acid-binding protein